MVPLVFHARIRSITVSYVSITRSKRHLTYVTPMNALFPVTEVRVKDSLAG